jgi:hypothetical protein
VAVDQKVEHLKFAQAVVARMGTNSFLLKGWTVTLVATLFAFGAKEADRAFVVIAWVPVVVFAGLDAYFLRRERLFRRLYDKVAVAPADAPVSFSMDTSEYVAAETWWGALGSKTILWFYLPVALLLGVLTAYFALSPKAPAVPVQGARTITISIQ